MAGGSGGSGLAQSQQGVPCVPCSLSSHIQSMHPMQQVYSVLTKLYSGNLHQTSKENFSVDEIESKMTRSSSRNDKQIEKGNDVNELLNKIILGHFQRFFKTYHSIQIPT